jgi:hypothetical protein
MSGPATCAQARQIDFDDNSAAGRCVCRPCYAALVAAGAWSRVRAADGYRAARTSPNLFVIPHFHEEQPLQISGTISSARNVSILMLRLVLVLRPCIVRSGDEV